MREDGSYGKQPRPDRFSIGVKRSPRVVDGEPGAVDRMARRVEEVALVPRFARGRLEHGVYT